jgi:TPR repeat protein
LPSASAAPIHLVGKPPMQVNACLHEGPREEVELFQRACDLLDAEGCREIALRYYCGTQIERSVDRAARLAQKACDLGLLLACPEADDFFREAGELGDRRPPHGIPASWSPTPSVSVAAAPAEARPSDCARETPRPTSREDEIFTRGNTIYMPMTIDAQPTAEQEAQWLPRSEEDCRCGDMISCRAIGSVYLRGRGTSPNPTRAVELLTRTCDLNDAPACSELAYAYAIGAGVARDAARAKSLLQRACTLRYGEACTLLGRSLVVGDISLVF